MKIDKALGIHEQALLLKARRAEVLSGNIANADTPGYKARDFDFQQILRQQMPLSQPVRVTNERHIQPDAGLMEAAYLGYRVPLQPSLDGNTVDTHLEHAAFASNALEYQASLRFLSGDIRKLKTAIKGQ